MEQGKISVVVPVYNGAKWIEECVKSVQAQTWTNWEMLILDDRSSDGTDRIAQKMAEEDSRIRFVERRKKGVSSAILDDRSSDGTDRIAQKMAEEDSRIRFVERRKKGVSSARNQGIEETDGEFLTFVDADDKLDARMFEVLADCLEKENSEIAVCDYYRNQGIEETDGEFLTFVDADDKLDARMFEVLADCLEKENSEIAVCDYYRWDGTENGLCDRSGRKIEESYAVKAKAVSGRFTVDRDAYVGQYLLHGNTRCWSVLYRRSAVANVRFREDLTIGEDTGRFTVDRDAYVGQYLLHGNTRCWSVLYRRSAVANVRFREDLTIGEDMMFLVDLMPGLKRITLTDYRGYFYRINESGAMLRPFTLSYMDEIKGWKLACEKISAGWPEQKARVNSILAVSAMLAAGKLSRLSAKERAKYREQAAECREAVRQALRVPGAKEELPEGYRVKTALYTLCPAMYLRLYHIWKKE